MKTTLTLITSFTLLSCSGDIQQKPTEQAILQREDIINLQTEKEEPQNLPNTKTNNPQAGGEPQTPSIELNLGYTQTNTYTDKAHFHIIHNYPSPQSTCSIRLQYVCGGILGTKHITCSSVNDIDFYASITKADFDCSHELTLSIRPSIKVDGYPSENETTIYTASFSGNNFKLTHMPLTGEDKYINPRDVTKEKP